ncbi:MAG: ATP phosphoribosyltransferase [Candidatus Omnitrophica bacterium]|nr:ATP phosphoribosyltransferase [Candidatus Omnitrophota bacterium]
MDKKVLKLGLPKGSLQEATFKLFRMAGFEINVESRSYFPSVDDDQIQAVLIRAQEMSRYVEEGVLDCGITGEDWVRENDSHVLRVAELIYAKRTLKPVRWVIAVRDDSSIKSVKDLQGKRIATELVNVTKSFLKKNRVKASVEFSWGATEVKVKSGLADAIVELTETGSSLRANNLREIACVCTSSTKFIANKKSRKDLWKKKKMDYLILLLLGAIEAQGKVGIKLNVKKKDLDKVINALPALRKPTISNLSSKDWYALEVIIEEVKIKELIPLLKECGAEGIVEYPLNKIIH